MVGHVCSGNGMTRRPGRSLRRSMRITSRIVSSVSGLTSDQHVHFSGGPQPCSRDGSGRAIISWARRSKQVEDMVRAVSSPQGEQAVRVVIQ